MKSCIACLVVKPIAEFYTHPRMADGHLNKCISCCRAYAKGRPDMHMKTDKRSAANAANAKRWRGVNPKKARAHNAVNNAIRDGKLVRQPCEKCGAWAHAHHDDYDKPLDVRWLCPKHHSKEHHEFVSF